MIEPEETVDKILALRLKYQSLKDQKKTLTSTLSQSEQIAMELRAKANEASRIQELTIAHLSGASSSNNASSPKKERPQSFVYAERKLGIKHNIVELDKLVNSKEKAVDVYESKLRSLKKQVKKAQHNISVFPARYQESSSDIQKQLLKIMREKSELETHLCSLEGSGDELLSELRIELSSLYRDISDKGEEYRESKNRIDSLTQKIAQKQMIAKPMRARVERLQREITESYGEEGLLMVAMELMGDKNMLKVSLIDIIIRDFFNPEHVAIDSDIQRCLSHLGLENESHVSMSQLGQILDELGVPKSGYIAIRTDNWFFSENIK